MIYQISLVLFAVCVWWLMASSSGWDLTRSLVFAGMMIAVLIVLIPSFND